MTPGTRVCALDDMHNGMSGVVVAPRSAAAEVYWDAWVLLDGCETPCGFMAYELTETIAPQQDSSANVPENTPDSGRLGDVERPPDRANESEGLPLPKRPEGLR